jgi:hypothetical protein
MIAYEGGGRMIAQHTLNNGDVVAEVHEQDIIEGRLCISYEPEDTWEGPDGEIETEEARAVFLLQRCCPINHEHISIDKMQAVKLSHWLHRFITGEFDE